MFIHGFFVFKFWQEDYRIAVGQGSIQILLYFHMKKNIT